MKPLLATFFTVALLFSQWGSIDHVYHDHTAGEVCDYCVTAKSFDHAAANSSQIIISSEQTLLPEILVKAFITKSISHHYAVRGPPRLI